MDFKEQLMHYKKLVEEDIEKFFVEKQKKFGYRDEFVNEAIEVLKDYTLRGGKRLRSTLITMTYRGYSGDLSDTKIIRPSSSVEFMQSYLLTHDDLMDEALIRRNKPTPHVWIADWYKKKIENNDKKAKKFGSDMAIVLGDIFNNFGVECLLEADFPAERKLEACWIYNNTAETTGKGQLLDIWFSMRKGKPVTEQDHLNVIDRKTVEYTIEKPMLMGAALANVPEAERKIIHNYAFPLGRAFQLQDDLLDYYASEEKLGKAVLTDLREGKHTIVLIKALEKATPEQKKFLMSMVGKYNPSEEEIERVRKIIKDTGSYDYSKKIIDDYINESKKWIDKMHCSQELKDFCWGFADYMAKREY
ncbi:MAG: polyprenyl synthetase family protein [archaeon]